jgi:hypothetical protein
MSNATNTQEWGDYGERAVEAQLRRRGWDVKRTPRNYPSLDMYASKDGRTISIQVKTSRPENRAWHIRAKPGGEAALADLTILPCSLAWKKASRYRLRSRINLLSGRCSRH